MVPLGNTQYGHDVGGQALLAVADVMQQRLRSTDTPARKGGKEFLILLPDTDLPGTQKVAESIRKTISSLELKAGKAQSR